MKTRIIIYADDGKVLTDGNIYGTQIYLEDKRSANEFREITQEEYKKIAETETEMVSE